MKKAKKENKASSESQLKKFTKSNYIITNENQLKQVARTR
jgi:hypothetical protein